MRLFDMAQHDCTPSALQLALEHGGVAVMWSGNLSDALLPGMAAGKVRIDSLDDETLIQFILRNNEIVAVYNVGQAHKSTEENPAAAAMRESCVDVCGFAAENAKAWGLDLKTIEHIRERILRR